MQSVQFNGGQFTFISSAFNLQNNSTFVSVNFIDLIGFGQLYGFFDGLMIINERY